MKPRLSSACNGKKPPSSLLSNRTFLLLLPITLPGKIVGDESAATIGAWRKKRGENGKCPLQMLFFLKEKIQKKISLLLPKSIINSDDRSGRHVSKALLFV